MTRHLLEISSALSLLRDGDGAQRVPCSERRRDRGNNGWEVSKCDRKTERERQRERERERETERVRGRERERQREKEREKEKESSKKTNRNRERET